MEKVKLGIIGCGLAAQELHSPAILKLKDKFEVTALCNHTEPKAKELSEILGIKVPIYLDYKEFLNSKDVEAVDIALPIGLNYQVTKDSLEAGKHVLLEKPLAGNLDEAKEMLSFPEKYKKVTLVAENFRYRKVFKEVKELLKNKRIGHPYTAVWNLYFHVTADYKYGATRWRQHHDYPGGFIYDAGVHNVAALRILFGEITSVNAFTKSINPEIGVPDTMSMQFETEMVKGVYNIFFTVKGHWENKFLIFGDEGTIEVNENIIQIKIPDKPVETIDASDDSGYYEEFLDFYNAVRNGSKVKSSFHEGYKDAEVVLAALRSAEEKRIITL